MPTAFAGVINTTDITQVLSAIGVPEGTTATYSGDPAAIGYSTTPLANFPPGSDVSFGILSTGRVNDIPQANTSGSQGTDLGSVGTAGDSATLTLNLQIPESPQKAAAIGFNFTFLSEEFPEWVGSTYNDQFRAFINGTNIALDTNGNPIDVNNNFFSAQLTPTGTFFDGQTPPLAIRAALPENTDTATLSFNVADLGDGVYDSTVFIQGLEYLFPQTLYLAFEDVSAEAPSILGTSTYTKPSAGLSAAQQATVVNQVGSIFNDFLIEVTNVRPSGGDYSTIYVGGTKEDLPLASKFLFDENTIGKASSIDIGNENMNDFALVFSGESFFLNIDATANLDKITQVVAHEAGHILGLFHVEPSSELLYPFADDPSRTSIRDSIVNRAEIDSDTNTVTPIDSTQNSYQELARNVGLKNAAIIIGEPSLADQLLKNIKIIFGSLFSSVYNARLGVVLSHDAFPTFFDLGQINEGDVVDLQIPLADSFSAFLLGSSAPGNEVDIFGTSNGIASLDPTGINVLDLLSPLAGMPTFNLFQSDGTRFNSVGEVTLNLAPNSNVPEPSTFLLLIIGLLTLLWQATVCCQVSTR